MSDEPAPQVRRPALSPSRASDFKQCPLLYRFRAIDRLPEPSSTAQVRGSVVHAALEQLYALPAAERGRDTAMSLVDPAWERVVEGRPELAADIEPALRAELLDEARALLSGYYRLEDPTRFDPQSCEQRVEVELSDGTLLRGFVDRIDVAPTGELRVVDYKTGKAPPEARALAEFRAMFQMKFYAVALLRSRGVLPARLRLLYLSDGQVLDYTPDLDELLRFEKTAAVARCAARPAAAAVSVRRSSTRLHPRSRRAPALREDVDGDLAGHPIRRRHRRFPAASVTAVRLVCPPHALSGVRRHSPAVPRLAGGPRRG